MFSNVVDLRRGDILENGTIVARSKIVLKTVATCERVLKTVEEREIVQTLLLNQNPEVVLVGNGSCADSTNFNVESTSGIILPSDNALDTID
jgi:hypothetical protein